MTKSKRKRGQERREAARDDPPEGEDATTWGLLAGSAFLVGCCLVWPLAAGTALGAAIAGGAFLGLGPWGIAGLGTAAAALAGFGAYRVVDAPG